MDEDRQEAAVRTIDFWNNLGFFIQPDIPTARDVSKSNTKEKIDRLYFSESFSSFENYIYAENSIMTKYPLMSNSVLFWIGSVDRAEYFRRLSEELGISEELDLDEREKNGRIAFCSFRTDINGDNITDLRVSPLLWTAQYQRETRFSDVSGSGKYDSYINDLRSSFDKYQSSLEGLISGRNVDEVAEDLYKKLRTDLCADMYIGEDDAPRAVITHIYTCYSTEESKKSDNVVNRYFGDIDFFSTDLGFVRYRIESGKFGDNSEYEKRVIDYILAGSRTEDISARIAIQPDTEDKDSIRELFGKIFDISRFPLGKWPSGNCPVLMQQAAVNIASSDMAPPIFTVNGPPGSGKTTLLKEIIADRMVKRAMILSQIVSEAHRNNTDIDKLLFYEKKTSGGTAFYSIRNKDINKLGLVAAAVSNNAAENISKEFPIMTEGFGLLSEQYGDYFGERACDLFGKEEGKCFGLLSVPLGKMSNVTRFSSCVLDHLYDDADKNDNDSILREINRKFTEQLGLLTDLTKSRTEFLDDSFYSSYFSSSRKSREKAECTFFNIVFTDKNRQISFDEEREKLFYYACILHRELVRSSKCLRANYGLLRNIWHKDGTDADMERIALSEECLPDIFPTLFLLAPLISATFASFGSFMKDLKKSGSLGTLIIDEAGQAAPMLAVGALYRCSSAIIVGDPEQIPPIYGSDTINRIFAGRYDITTALTVGKDSVQTFADSLNLYGRYLGSGEGGKEWVGCPLTVHRRCDDPMFSIANEISYDSSLIRKTPTRPSGKNKLVLQSSYWVNVPEKASYIRTANYYMENQGRAALRLLAAAFAKHRGKIPDIFIISPFLTVANGISVLIRGSEFYRNIPAVRDWYEENRIGTVYTFQGREAAEVILVLGCSSKSVAVTDFVNKNIVNTAVTRAQRRLYVIGDISVWEQNSSVKTAFDIMTDHGHDKFTDEDGLNRMLTTVDRGKCPKCGAKLVETVSEKGSYVTCAEKECENYRKALLPLSFGRIR